MARKVHSNYAQTIHLGASILGMHLLVHYERVQGQKNPSFSPPRLSKSRNFHHPTSYENGGLRSTAPPRAHPLEPPAARKLSLPNPPTKNRQFASTFNIQHSESSETTGAPPAANPPGWACLPACLLACSLARLLACLLTYSFTRSVALSRPPSWFP